VQSCMLIAGKNAPTGLRQPTARPIAKVCPCEHMCMSACVCVCVSLCVHCRQKHTNKSQAAYSTANSQVVSAHVCMWMCMWVSTLVHLCMRVCMCMCMCVCSLVRTLVLWTYAQHVQPFLFVLCVARTGRARYLSSHLSNRQTCLAPALISHES